MTGPDYQTCNYLIAVKVLHKIYVGSWNGV